MLVLLHPDQAAEACLLSEELGISLDEIVRHLLSGPLLQMTTR